jgi:hypothetical protein
MVLRFKRESHQPATPELDNKVTRGRVRTAKAFAKRIRRFRCISHAVLWSAMRPGIAFETYGNGDLEENCLR